MISKPYHIIFLLLFLGLGLRLFLVFGMPIRDTVTGEPQHFDTVAWNLASGNGYSASSSVPFLPMVDRPPVYFVFIAAIYRLLGYEPLWVRLFQILIDLGTCLLVFGMAKDCFGMKAAYWALAISCLNPFLSVYTAALLPTTLTVFLLTLSVFFMSKAVRTLKPFLFIVTGISLGALILCREENEFIPILFGIFLIGKFRQRSFRSLIALGVGLVLFMSPWWIRNYHVSGRFIPVTYGGAVGRALYFSTVQQVFERDATYFEMLPGELRSLWEQTHSSRYEDVQKAERRFAEIGWERIRKDPIGYFFRRLANYPKFWIGMHPDEFVILESGILSTFHPNFKKMEWAFFHDQKEIALLGLKYFLLFLSTAYVILAGYGIWVCRKLSLPGLLYVKLTLFYYAVIFFIVITEPRYSIPVHPFLSLFAALPIALLADPGEAGGRA